MTCASAKSCCGAFVESSSIRVQNEFLKPMQCKAFVDGRTVENTGGF